MSKISYEPRVRTRNEDTLDKLRNLADDASLWEMRQIVQRDATLKLILLLPEPILEQALAVGKALQACAEHRRMTFEGPEEDYRTS